MIKPLARKNPLTPFCRPCFANTGVADKVPRSRKISSWNPQEFGVNLSVLTDYHQTPLFLLRLEGEFLKFFHLVISSSGAIHDKKMIDVYGWTIIEEDAPGKGARFDITIPNP